MAVHKDFNGAFKAMYRKLESVQKSLPNVLANEGTKFFISNFDLSGFTDVGFQAWAPRKVDKKKRDKNRKILVKTGKLRRAVNKSVAEKSFKRIVWKIDSGEVPYAMVHNEGQTVYKKAHKRTATVTRIIKGSYGQLGDEKKKGKKVKMMGARHNVSATNFKMPRRHFMGNSEFLNKRFKLRIKQIYAKAFSS